jgi:hypothetical protein
MKGRVKEERRRVGMKNEESERCRRTVKKGRKKKEKRMGRTKDERKLLIRKRERKEGTEKVMN